MRILLASSHGADLSLGGAERYVSDLAQGLAARGHELQVMTAFPVRTDGSAATTLTLHRTDWREDRLRRLRNHAGDVVARPNDSLERAIRAARPEIVHTSNLPGLTTAVWEVARRYGAGVVHTLHDFYLLCPRVTLLRRDGAPCRPHPMLCGLRTRRLLRWRGAVDVVLAGSDYLLKAHHGVCWDDRSRVVRLPLAPVAARPLRQPATPPRVLGYLGAVERTKGVEALVSAAPRLAELGVVVRIAGAGRMRHALETIPSPGVEYVGVVQGDDKPAFLEEADIAVIPSVWAEPSGPPYALLEWLASGRPALASTRGGLGEAQSLPGVRPIEPTEDGIVDGLRKLLDPEAWREACDEARQVLDSRDTDRWLDEHEAAYHQALGR